MIKPEITFPDFVKIDLRIGTILEALRVDGSERLIKLLVDLGSEIGKRQVIAGIGLKYTPEGLLNKQIVVIVNLAPRKMMGLDSNGMILAGGDEEIYVLTPDKKAPNGTVVR